MIKNKITDKEVISELEEIQAQLEELRVRSSDLEYALSDLSSYISDAEDNSAYMQQHADEALGRVENLLDDITTQQIQKESNAN